MSAQSTRSVLFAVRSIDSSSSGYSQGSNTAVRFHSLRAEESRLEIDGVDQRIDAAQVTARTHRRDLILRDLLDVLIDRSVFTDTERAEVLADELCSVMAEHPQCWRGSDHAVSSVPADSNSSTLLDAVTALILEVTHDEITQDEELTTLLDELTTLAVASRWLPDEDGRRRPVDVVQAQSFIDDYVSAVLAANPNAVIEWRDPDRHGIRQPYALSRVQVSQRDAARASALLAIEESERAELAALVLERDRERLAETLRRIRANVDERDDDDEDEPHDDERPDVQHAQDAHDARQAHLLNLRAARARRIQFDLTPETL